MYKSLEEICEMTTKEGKPFWKIVQEDDCREQGISEGEAFEQMRGMYQAMREADDNYDGKLKSASGLVGTDGEKMHAARCPTVCHLSPPRCSFSARNDRFLRRKAKTHHPSS